LAPCHPTSLRTAANERVLEKNQGRYPMLARYIRSVCSRIILALVFSIIAALFSGTISISWAATPPLSQAALAECDSADVVITTNITISAGNMTYDGLSICVDGATVTIDGAHTFASLYLTAGSVITHSQGAGGFSLNIDGRRYVDRAGGERKR
jgi:hypothetical protein